MSVKNKNCANYIVDLVAILFSRFYNMNLEHELENLFIEDNKLFMYIQNHFSDNIFSNKSIHL